MLGGTGLLLAGLHYGYVELPQFGGADDGRILERRLLQERIRSLSTERERLTGTLVGLERQRQVERQAETEIGLHLRQLEDEMSILKQEVSFYRGILSGDRGRGFVVESFSATPGDGDRSYRFRIVLTHDSKDHKVMEGFVGFSVDGEVGGKPAHLTLRELTGRDDPGFEFRFRLFQQVEGVLELSDHFIPRVVNIEISGADGDVSGIRRSFDWPGTSGIRS